MSDLTFLKELLLIYVGSLSFEGHVGGVSLATTVDQDPYGLEVSSRSYGRAAALLDSCTYLA